MAIVTAMLPDATDLPLPRAGRLGRVRFFRRENLAFVWGLMDQAILSGCSLLLTLVLANALDVKSFGRFSIAWAFTILLEAVLFRGLFDDGLPAVAHRLPKARWPQLRTSLYVASMTISGVFGVALIVPGLVALGLHDENAALLITTGLAIPANRLQSVFRRIGYLDGKLPRVASGAVVFAVVIAGSSAVMIETGITSAATAMFCVALSATAAGVFGLIHVSDFARPRRRVLKWSVGRLLRSGRWFVANSLSYWISSIGLIPFCGMLIGLEASASLRIMLVVFAPLSQFNASMLSVKLPRTAERLRSHDRAVFVSATRSNALLFGGASAFYGVVATLIGVPLLSLLVKRHGFELSEINLSLMALAMCLDGVWLGLALPLFALGRPQRFLVSRIAGLLMLCVSLPFGAYMWGVTGVIGAMALSSLVSVCVLGFGIIKPHSRLQPKRAAILIDPDSI